MIFGLSETEVYVILAIVLTSALFYVKTKYKGMMLAACYKAMKYIDSIEVIAPEATEILEHGRQLIKDFEDMIADDKITVMELRRIYKDIQDVMEHVTPFVKKLNTKV